MSPLGVDAPTYSLLPSLCIAWVQAGHPDPYPAERSALLPLYLTPDREVQLGELRLPCTGTEASWLQAGAALFLNGDA